MYWTFRSEFAYNSSNLLNRNISMTFRQLQIHESFSIARPQLEISFYGYRTKYTLDMMKVKTINRKTFHVQSDGTTYYSFTLMALLKEKSRNEYFSWDLQENVAESLNSDDVEGVTISLSTQTYSDKIRLRLKDTLALHDKSISEYLEYSLYEFFIYDTSYRVLWLPLIYRKRNKMNQDLVVDTVIPLEVYIELDPETIDCYKYL